MANDLTRVIALADLGEAVLAAVKESGLARKKRRTARGNGRRGKKSAKVTMGVKTTTTVSRPKASASKKPGARKPLMDQIPD